MSVKNFALIENISIDFENGLTVLTGETGAGKSLIIDAISLLLGGRASSLVIRSGCSKTIIEGVFIEYNQKINELLDLYGIEIDNNQLVLRREINLNGKNISRINGSLVTVSQLEKIGKYLVDIHTQFDTKKIFDVVNYVDFLTDEKIETCLLKYRHDKIKYFSLLKEFNKLKSEKQDYLDNFDYLKHRLEELKTFNLDEFELDKLEEELGILNNYQVIHNNFYNIKALFENNNIVKSLFDIRNYLDKNITFDSTLIDLLKTVENAYYELEDVELCINNKFDNLEFDQSRIDQLYERINALKNIQRKYKMTISELISYKNSLEDKISNYDNFDLIMLEKENELINLRSILLQDGLEISKYRKFQANILKENVISSLNELCLPHVRFEIVFDEIDLNNDSIFKDNGIDNIDFMISFNLGEQLKSLSKVASGGEMSRVMLAFKTHLLNKLKLSTIVFDEIDTGISGEVALTVANKIKMISKNTQVLAITHLPIVAACCDNHLFVFKQIEEDRTVTKIKKIDLNERILCLAKMITSTSNESAIALAKQMIDKF